MEAESLVPLDGLAASDTTRTFTVTEAIDGVDRNGDGDTNDSVMTLRARATGLSDSLGAAVRDAASAARGAPKAARVDTSVHLPGRRGRERHRRVPRTERTEAVRSKRGRRRVRRPARIFRLGLGETITTPPTVDTRRR
jgi:hypothetical protein